MFTSMREYLQTACISAADKEVPIAKKKALEILVIRISEGNSTDKLAFSIVWIESST